MRKVIDLCLDMPMGAEALTNMLSAMCLDPLYRGYKKTYGAGVAAQVGLTVEEIDAIYESAEACMRSSLSFKVKTSKETKVKSEVTLPSVKQTSRKGSRMSPFPQVPTSRQTSSIDICGCSFV